MQLLSQGALTVFISRIQFSLTQAYVMRPAAGVLSDVCAGSERSLRFLQRFLKRLFYLMMLTRREVIPDLFSSEPFLLERHVTRAAPQGLF